MEISRDALMRVVLATRMADKLSIDTQSLLTVPGIETRAGVISGLLMDVIFEMLGECLTAEEDFCQTSLTMKLLESDLSDNEVADYILHRSALPKPQTMSSDETRMMFERNGGYKYTETPEGEYV